MLTKIYTWIVLLFVPLTIYKINILTFTLADALLILAMPFLLIDMLMIKKRANINIHILIVTFGIFAHMLILVFFNHSEFQNDTLMRTLRYISYLLFIAVFAREYFNVRLGLKLLRIISVLSSVYLIIQFILLNYFNYYLSGFLPGLPLSSESLDEIIRRYSLGYSKRPTSIFQEPAHFSSYVLLYFGILLFDDTKKQKNELILIGIAIILSGSSTGILLAIGLLLLWTVRSLKNLNNLNKILNYVILIAFIGFCFLLFTKTQIFNSFIERTFENRTATTGRLGNYKDVFYAYDISLVQQIIGHGMLKYDEYIPSIPRIYFYFGGSGLLLFCLYSLRYLIIKKGYKRISLIILLVSTLGTEIAFGSFMLLYLPFIIDLNSNKDKFEKIPDLLLQN
ncbi:hypothetical protein [Paenibacillus typhae]|uniref:hypothetical protein n=1 Tax=Paenibacillus typhae TaxID=1174501 RepID=UPI001C8D04F6|nr:hypothetical protein [Paenibacillus typhae]MBY0013627.1 hypothetical protein [Paenibacillus typhae]